jgi:predicted nucleic acid-binding protein
MSHYLIDTGLLLRHVRGQRSATRALRGYGQMGRLAISAITRLEVHAGMRPDERYATVRLLSRFVTIDVDRDVADRAGDLVRERNTRGAPIGVADAIIAATAMTRGLTLVTLNHAHFQGIPGLSVAPFNDEDA